MSQDDPLMILISCALCLYLAKIWYSDYKIQEKGEVLPSALPGATSCSLISIIVAVLGALFILAGETCGEYALGVSEEQEDITFLFLGAMLSASFVEELIFRGYLVVENKGRAMLICGILACSLLFAVLHPYLWEFSVDEGKEFWNFESVHFGMNLSSKGLFSTSILFINSVWFYFVRFSSLNPSNSLIPCFAAHLSSNVGVFVIKLAQGHVSGLFC